MFKSLESVITKSIIKWNKLKTITISAAMALMLILVGVGTLTVDKSICTLAVFPVMTLFVIFYAKTIGVEEAKREFAAYRRKWNETFRDNSFDSYFKLNDYFDFLFESEFLFQMNRRLLKMATENNFKRFAQKNTRSNEVMMALKYFGYSSIKDINKEILKRKYREELRRVHPDAGGTVEETEKLIKYYNVLKEAI